MQSFEDKFRAKYPDCRLEILPRSDVMDQFHVYVGNLHCGDSGVRDYAFRWALEDIAAGKIVIPPGFEQAELFPLRG